MKLCIFLSIVIASCFLQSAEAQVNNDADSVFTMVEQQAQFPGGFEAMAKFLSKQLKFPAKCRGSEDLLVGSIFLSFIVNKDGSISDISLLKSIGEGCDEEAIRVISISPNWIPATRGGKPVRSRFVLPIKF